MKPPRSLRRRVEELELLEQPRGPELTDKERAARIAQIFRFAPLSPRALRIAELLARARARLEALP